MTTFVCVVISSRIYKVKKFHPHLMINILRTISAVKLSERKVSQNRGNIEEYSLLGQSAVYSDISKAYFSYIFRVEI